MSTAPTIPPAPPSQPPASQNQTQHQHPPWETEPPYQHALARLETLQNQIDTLRLTVPILMRCFSTKNATPESIFRDFQNATMTPSKALVGLKNLLEESETKELLERARSGFARDIALEDGVKECFKEVGRFGWVEKGREGGKGGGKRKRDDKEEGEGEVVSEEEIRERVRKIGERERVAAAEWDKDTQTIKIKVRSPAGILPFTITRKVEDKHAVYTVQGPSCEEKLRGLFAIYSAIDRCLEKRPRRNDLDYTLDMITAYKDLREAKCDKCKELLDKFAMTPAARRSKKVKSAKGDEDVWIAVHESCL